MRLFNNISVGYVSVPLHFILYTEFGKRGYGIVISRVRPLIKLTKYKWV